MYINNTELRLFNPKSLSLFPFSFQVLVAEDPLEVHIQVNVALRAKICEEIKDNTIAIKVNLPFGRKFFDTSNSLKRKLLSYWNSFYFSLPCRQPWLLIRRFARNVLMSSLRFAKRLRWQLFHFTFHHIKFGWLKRWM